MAIDPQEARTAVLTHLRRLLDAMEDGVLSKDDVMILVADAVDEIIPTGPLDPYDDAAILSAVRKVWEIAEKIDLKRDPENIRLRAARALAKGKTDRHAALLEIALKVEAKQRGG